MEQLKANDNRQMFIFLRKGDKWIDLLSLHTWAKINLTENQTKKTNYSVLILICL